MMGLQALQTERKQAQRYPDDYSALLDIIGIDRELVRQGGLREYSQLVWPELHPGIELAWGWAHDAVADLFHAWIHRQVKDIVINIPFRMAKSTIGSVAAPSYAWTVYPHLRFLTVSYRDDLSTRDAVKSRRLMQSRWYQARWGDKFRFVSDQNQKCLMAGTRIVMGNGKLKAIENLKSGDMVFSIDLPSGKMVKDTVMHVWCNGDKPVRKITLSDGTVIHATHNHRFYGWDSWAYVRDMAVGDPVAVLKRLPAQNGELSIDDAFLLAFWLAEGNKSASSYEVHSIDDKLLSRLREIAISRNWDFIKYDDCSYRLSAGRRQTGDTPMSVLKKHIGVKTTMGGRSRLLDMQCGDIRIPDCVFNAGDTAMAEFVGTYISCDGSVITKKNHGLVITSISEFIIRDFAMLLKRFQVNSRIVPQKTYFHYNGERRQGKRAWHLYVMASDDIKKLRGLDLYGKNEKFRNLLQWCDSEKRHQGGRSASIPSGWDADLPGKKFPGKGGWASRRSVMKFAEENNHLGLLDKMNGDLDWRRIVDIEDMGKIETWHIETRETGTFIAEGIFSHNTRYENDKGGYRLAQSITGGSTGEGGNLIIWDDPHNVGRAESDIERTKVCVHHDEEMASRLDDQRRDGRAIIMQRLHEGDLSGHVLKKDLGYVHLCLPMQFDPKRKCVIDMNGFHFEDPRTEEGELLEPIRFPDYVVKKLEKELGPYAAAGQLQQQPAPRKGGAFDVDMIEIVDAEPSPAWMIQARYWDKAGTRAEKAKGKGAFTAGVKLAKIRRGPHKGKFIILDVIRGQWSAGPREQVIKNTAIRDGKAVRVYVEQEPGSGGKESAENTVGNLAGWIVAADRPTGDKALRAEPMASQIKMGNFLMLRAPWNGTFLHELRMFPVGSQKDQVDAAAAAFNLLTAAKTGGFTW